MAKLDPYLNVDPGTLNPGEHGEVFVTACGAEVDLDGGHYERVVGVTLDGSANATSGQVYSAVLDRERAGGYLGHTVQVVPHITDEIKARIRHAGAGADIAVIEVGGTVGDIEILPFLEAIRQFRLDVGRANTLNVHLTLIPAIGPGGEQKTKPTQHSVAELRSRGITPDIIVARSDRAVPDELKVKISRLCDVDVAHVIAAPDVDNIYEIPVVFSGEGLDTAVLDTLGVDAGPCDLSDWTAMLERSRVAADGRRVRVGIVGKYVGATDAYLSVLEALRHAAVHHGVRLELVWCDADDPDTITTIDSRDVDAVCIPGGFGPRGVDGIVAAASAARRSGVPTLGLCLGLQAMVISAARTAGHDDANSTEFDPDTSAPVVTLLDSQRDVTTLGATMRLGAHVALLADGSKVAAAYGERFAVERHRHRYEVNPQWRDTLTAAGIDISGVSPDGRLVEYIEDRSHPFWVATQAHPEFTSRPLDPHPLFCALIAAT
jgi:CTP synthase